MKVESRGKFPGVKLHLDPEEVEIFLAWDAYEPPTTAGILDSPDEDFIPLIAKIAKKILKLEEEVPNLLQERTPEQVLAILTKEAEKSAIQLAIAEKGGDISKVDPEELKKALLKHVKEKK